MQNFVDQAHGVDLAGPDRPFRMPDEVASAVHLDGEYAGRVKIGENRIAAESEKGVVESVLVSGFARDVEFVREGRFVESHAVHPDGWKRWIALKYDFYP
jgi:hypothetical protein